MLEMDPKQVREMMLGKYWATNIFFAPPAKYHPPGHLEEYCQHEGHGGIHPVEKAGHGQKAKPDTDKRPPWRRAYATIPESAPLEKAFHHRMRGPCS